jgi:hypothetical protein
MYKVIGLSQERAIVKKHQFCRFLNFRSKMYLKQRDDVIEKRIFLNHLFFILLVQTVADPYFFLLELFGYQLIGTLVKKA